MSFLHFMLHLIKHYSTFEVTILTKYRSKKYFTFSYNCEVCFSCSENCFTTVKSVSIQNRFHSVILKRLLFLTNAVQQIILSKSVKNWVVGLKHKEAFLLAWRWKWHVFGGCQALPGRLQFALRDVCLIMSILNKSSASSPSSCCVWQIFVILKSSKVMASACSKILFQLQRMDENAGSWRRTLKVTT